MASPICTRRPLVLTVPVAHFVSKLYQTVQDGVCAKWSDDGLSFFIMDPEAFVMSVSSRCIKLGSLHRSLNLYGFAKVREASCECYAHPKFQRDNAELLPELTRCGSVSKRDRMEVAVSSAKRIRRAAPAAPSPYSDADDSSGGYEPISSPPLEDDDVSKQQQQDLFQLVSTLCNRIDFLERRVMDLEAYAESRSDAGIPLPQLVGSSISSPVSELSLLDVDDLFNITV